MKNPIILTKTKELYLAKDATAIKGELVMSILNMCMNIGSLDINIKINRNKDKDNSRNEKSLHHKKRLEAAIENRNNIEQKYYLNNILQ